MTLEESLSRLTDTARGALLRQAQLLSEGYTGEITLRCSQGGVREIRVGRVWSGESLAEAARHLRDSGEKLGEAARTLEHGADRNL